MCLKLNNVLSNGSEKKTVCMYIYRERHSETESKCGKMLQLTNFRDDTMSAHGAIISICI